MHVTKTANLQNEKKFILKMYKNEKDNEMISNYEKQGMTVSSYY